jgi:hypothetical protein
MVEKQKIAKYLLGFLGLAAVLLTAIFGTGQQSLGLDKITKDSVELTIYNEDLALVKEQRTLEVTAGIGSLSFSDVTECIDPTSVQIRSISNPGLQVLEQNYEYDVISSDKLLQKYLGQKISITTPKGDTIEGYLLGTGDNLIISDKPSGGQVKIISRNEIGSIAFPELPGGLVIKPTLAWLLHNPGQSGKQSLELTYLTGGLSWKADYIATINAEDNQVDLAGWVTLDNKSGGSFNEARLKLVAGDVNRVQDEEYPTKPEGVMKSIMRMEEKNEAFKEESFFEYHLYTLQRPTTIKTNQSKQVELLSAFSVPAKKRFIYEGAYDRNKVKVTMEFENTKKNNLGMPLPKGKIRVQKADSEGALQFIGEDLIDHTPKDEKIRIYLGNAFDIVGERTRANISNVSKSSREESIRIKLRNHKKEAVTVTAVEFMYGWPEWKITKSDHKYVKTESNKVEFTVKIPADGEVVINYTVRYNW